MQLGMKKRGMRNKRKVYMNSISMTKYFKKEVGINLEK